MPLNCVPPWLLVIIAIMCIILFIDSDEILHGDNDYIKIWNVPESVLNVDSVPPVVHRIRLYDSEFPEHILDCLEKFKRINPQFFHVLWNEQDVLYIMNTEEKNIYLNYPKKIQKADYARYIILKYYGGIYCDYDIDVRRSIYELYSKYRDNDCVLFEETTMSRSSADSTTEYSIRKSIPEVQLRIANYAMMSKPNSVIINDILEICKERSQLKINEDYDILYTTGPDVVSTSYDSFKDQIGYVPLKESRKYFVHLCAGHWRTGNIFVDLIPYYYNKYFS